MKKSINAWSVHNDTDFASMFTELKEAGFEAVELNLDAVGRSKHSLTMETTDEELASIRSMAEKAGIEISSVSTSLCGAKMGCADSHEELEEILFHQIKCAKALGTDCILLVPGADICGGADIKSAYETCSAFLAKCKSRIEKEEVYVGLENVWNGFFTSPFDMANFIDNCNSHYICAYYDIGNVVAFSDTASWIRILGDRIKRVHAKGFSRSCGLNRGGSFVDLTDGDINWSSVTEALKEIGYDGYFTAEVMPTKEYKDIKTFYKEVSAQETEILGGK